MKLSILFFVLVFLPFYSHGASFECSKATTEIEKAICDSDRLGSLDEELSFYYHELRELLSEVASSNLLREQRIWVRKRNSTCETAYNRVSCLSDFYIQRINTLKTLHEAPFFPSENELEKVCGEIAVLGSRSRREYGDTIDTYDKDTEKTLYDINNDGIKETAKSCISGTMQIPCVEYSLLVGEPLRIKTINYEWKDYWTYGLKIFSENGRWFSLHSYDDGLVKPAYVSYVTPENNEYVVCEFDNFETEVFEPNTDISHASEICTYFQDQDTAGIEFITLEEEPTMVRSEVQNLGMRETGLLRQGYVDYDNDGIRNYVGEFELASGSGRGCDFNFFDELTSDGKSLVTAPARNLFREMQGAHCGGLANKLFEHKDMVFYYLNTQEESKIAFIEREEIKVVCKVEKTIVTKVKRIGIPNK